MRIRARRTCARFGRIFANSARVKTLLAHRDKKGRLISGRGVYDKRQGAHWILAATSTFIHKIHSLRGVHLYGPPLRNRKALAAAKEASEIFLSRRLYKRKSNGAVIKEEFVRLHYPLYWHYDFLFGLKVMTEIGRIRDPRCTDALDLLESRQLPGGGWPAERRYYSVSKDIKLHADYVDWGGTSTSRMNPWVSADALSVLRSAGRWNPRSRDRRTKLQRADASGANSQIPAANSIVYLAGSSGVSVRSSPPRTSTNCHFVPCGLAAPRRAPLWLSDSVAQPSCLRDFVVSSQLRET